MNRSPRADRGARRFDDRLSALAELCVTVGVHVQRGQELIVSAPIEASGLVHHVGRIAYQRGAKLVTCLYDDPTLIRDRLLHAGDDSLDHAPEWIQGGVAGALEAGAARLHVVGPYPDLLAGIPADRIVRVHHALARASGAEAQLTAGSRINWSTVPYVTGSWARQVFPDRPAEEAARALWDAVFDVTRVDCPDPRGAWEAHNRALNARRDYLQSRRFAALRVYDGRTDLTIGLAEGHRWVGGTVVASNGVEGTCNIPSEEVFTCPHRERTDGRVFFSRPLALGGTLVENLSVELRDGVVTAVEADRGLEILEKLLASDEGARRLGEIGLVPRSSRIARTGILFYSALFDRNAASHVAFGQSQAACLASGDESSQRPEDAGANQSGVHIDCMFGSGAMNVDGVLGNGVVEPVMRGGEFVI